MAVCVSESDPWRLQVISKYTARRSKPAVLPAPAQRPHEAAAEVRLLLHLLQQGAHNLLALFTAPIELLWLVDNPRPRLLPAHSSSS
jgi:hypothetical protein